MQSPHASLSGAFQIAYIVRDMDRAIQVFAAAHGVTGFAVGTFALNLSFPKAPPTLKVGLTWVDGHEIELIEPVEDPTGIYASAVPSSAESFVFHHFGVRVPGDDLADWERFRTGIADDRVVIAGSRDGMRFIYVDARDTLGHYLEYIWMSPQFLAAHPGRLPPALRLQALQV